MSLFRTSNKIKLSKVQRRQDVRVSCIIPVYYTDNKYLLNIEIENKKAIEIITDIKRYLRNGMILDLSGGGLKLSCSEKFSLGQKLLLAFKTDDDYLIVKGEVIRNPINSISNVYIYGVRFINLNEEIKEKIVRYNFILMRKKRLKRG